MSLYAEYILERTDDRILETDFGFATYRYLNEGFSVYIVDIYIVPAQRGTHAATRMANEIAAVARVEGAREMLGTVALHKGWTTDNVKVLLAYGMTVHSATPEAIVFRKDL